jgi:predicted metal-dependent hydrolase
MKAPPLCIDMVIVHELCHIREMNHSSAFYALMDAAMPGWREASRQLDALSDQLLVD